MHRKVITANSTRTASRFSENVRKVAEYIDELSAVEQEIGFSQVSGADPDLDINEDDPADITQLIHLQHSSALELEPNMLEYDNYKGK